MEGKVQFKQGQRMGYSKVPGIHLKWPPPDWHLTKSSFRRVNLIGHMCSNAHE